MEFNLFDKKWLEVENSNHEFEKISLKEFISNPSHYLDLAFPFPGHNLAVFRFLLSLLYAWKQPQDEEEWYEMYKLENPFEPVEQFEETFRPYTDLLSEDKPFMQVKSFKEFKEKECRKDISAILLHSPADSGSRLFYHNNEFEMNLENIPSFLMSAQLFVPPKVGQRFKHISTAPIFFFIEGSNLKETILLNLISKDYLYDEVYDKSLMKKEQQAEDLKAFDENEIKGKDVSIVAGLNWRSRKIKLKYDQEKKIISGVYYTRSARPVSYWCDPFAVVQEDKDGNLTHVTAKKFSPLWKGYKNLFIGSLDNKNKMKFTKPLNLGHYENIVASGYDLPKYVKLSCFGVDYKGSQKYDSIIEDELLYSTILSENELLGEALEYIIEKTDQCHDTLRSALKKALNPGSKEDSKTKLPETSEGYWNGLDSKFKQLLHKLLQNEIEIDESKKRWEETLLSFTKKQFELYTSKVLLMGNSLMNLVKAENSLNIHLGKTLQFIGGKNGD